MGLNLTDVELVLPRPEFEEVKRLRGEESSFAIYLQGGPGGWVGGWGGGRGDSMLLWAWGHHPACLRWQPRRTRGLNGWRGPATPPLNHLQAR